MIFSILAFIAVSLSICIKDRKKSLCVQSLSCIFESLYAFTICAFTGAVLGIINFIRSCLFINKEKYNAKFYFSLLIIFELLVITNCIFTYEGLISLLPTTGSLIRTYCLWQSKMKYVRISGIATGVLFGTYYLYHQGWFMLMGYLVILIVSIISVCKNDIKRKV